MTQQENKEQDNTTHEEYSIERKQRDAIRKMMKPYFKKSKVQDGTYYSKDKRFGDFEFFYASPGGIVQMNRKKLYIKERKRGLDEKLKENIPNILNN